MKNLLMIMLLTSAGCGTNTVEDPGETAGPDAGTVEETADASLVPEPETCSPDNCAGCCDGDTCLSGSSGGACGSGGEACSDCGPHGICESDGPSSCQIDPSSRWNIVAVRADIPLMKENGDAWDVGGGAPDVFAIALLDDENIGDTSTIDNSFTPEWNENVAEGVRADLVEDVAVELNDSDVGNDDRVGRCSLPLFPYEVFVSGQEQTMTCNDASGYQIVLRLQPE